MAELEKYKYQVDLKLKDHHNIEQQKTDLERHVQSLIKVSVVKCHLTLLHTASSGLSPPFEGTWEMESKFGVLFLQTPMLCCKSFVRKH